jgi:Flp pilus assembly protein TadD
VKHAPKDATIRNNLGNVYLSTGNMKKAASANAPARQSADMWELPV